MHMGVDEACRNQALAIVGHRRVGKTRAHGLGRANRDDLAIFHNHRAVAFVPRRLWSGFKRIARKRQHLPQK